MHDNSLLLNCNLNHITVIACAPGTSQPRQDGECSACVSVQSSVRGGVVINWACFQLRALFLVVTAPSSRPLMSVFLHSPRDYTEKEGLFFWLLTQDNQHNHLLFCSGSTELENEGTWAKTFKQCGKSQGAFFFSLRKIYFCNDPAARHSRYPTPQILEQVLVQHNTINHMQIQCQDCP